VLGTSDGESSSCTGTSPIAYRRCGSDSRMDRCRFVGNPRNDHVLLAALLEPPHRLGLVQEKVKSESKRKAFTIVWSEKARKQNLV